jgi:hypothetical protein
MDGVGVKEKYEVEITNTFAALECLYDSLYINSAWAVITDNIKASAEENLGRQKLKNNT